MFRIGNIVGVRSKSVTGNLVINGGINAQYQLKLTINSGSEDGVRVLLASGPENPCPVAEKVIEEVTRRLKVSIFKGTLISLHGFADFIGKFKKPYEPLFPGWPDGDDGERVAYTIFQEILSQVDYAIFLEGPEPNITSIPHAAIYSIDDPPTMSCHPELCKMMGHDLIVEKTGQKGSLVIEAQREFGLPVLISQLDESDISEKAIKWNIERIFNFLSYAGLIDMDSEIPDRTFIASRTGEIRSEFEGELSLNPPLFSFLSSGDSVGSISKKEGNKKINIENETVGYVVRRRNNGHVMVNDFIYSVLEVHFKSYASANLYCNTYIDNREMQDVKIRTNQLFKRLSRT